MFSLKAGDKVGIASPAGHIPGFESIKLALDYIESLGLRYVIGANAYNVSRYMAGTDEERAEDLMSFFKDPEIKAVFTTAGGCGSQRLLDLLDYEIIKQNPKPVIGLSDNTALQLGLWTQTGNMNITGFSLKYDFKNGHIDGLVDASLQKVLSGTGQNIVSGQTQTAGTAEGILVGGCLSLIRSLAGTPYFPDLKDTILLIEDVGEKTYKLDLMLTQLRQQPGFSKIKGIVFGTFACCEEADPGDGSVNDVIDDFCCRIHRIPVIKNFAYGHIPSRYVLPTGVKVRLNADQCRLEYL